jgi:hypothetical protein
VPADLQPAHFVRKPFRSRDLVRALTQILRAAPADALESVARAG